MTSIRLGIARNVHQHRWDWDSAVAPCEPSATVVGRRARGFDVDTFSNRHR